MAKLTTLLFDVDGTLAETEEIHRKSFNSAFKAAGLSWVWSQATYGELLAVTGGKERIRHYIDKYSPDFKAEGNLAETIASLHATKTEHYTSTVRAGALPLRNGVRQLIHEARASGLRLGIATTTTPANVSVLLQKSLSADAESWFEVIAAGGVVPVKKPAPDIYHYAMEKMGVSPEECLALEDSENGLLSARGAGLKTIITVSQYTAGQDFSDAALVVDQFGEPDDPATAIKGSLGGSNIVNIELMHKLMAS
ncbi:MAG: HAD family hydrolase [Gammaproteobacteria bacterium]